LRLFRQFILRQLVRERLRSLVTIFGIALGIAVIVAIRMTNTSSVRGFATAIETVSGKTSLEIVGVGAGTGFDETKLTDLGWLRRYGNASPVVEGDAVARTADGAKESIRVLGVDILRDRSLRDYNLMRSAGAPADGRQPTASEFLTLLVDTDAVVLTEKFAARHGLEVGSTFELTAGDKATNFVVQGILAAEGPAKVLDGNFALMDIAAAQLAFDRLGRVDRLDVRLGESVSIDAAEAEIAAALPAGLGVQRPERRGRQVEKMLEAFQFNLTALSYIALLVGLFMIYNTVSTSVITRRQEIGTLRALGVTRWQVLGLFLAEALALAAIGCAVGVLLGRALAYGAVKITSTTVNALYIRSAAEPPPLGWEHIVLAFAVGLPLAALAAAAPALEASRVSPTAAMRGADRLESQFRLRRRYVVLPIALFGLAWALAQLPPVNGLPVWGYASAAAIVFGAAFLVPAVLYWVAKLGRRASRKFMRIEGQLAASNLSAAISRISISVAALAVSLAMMVAIAVMIGSFRETVVYWIGQTLKADLYMRPATRANVTVDATISPEVERAVASSPSVAAIERFRSFDVPYGEGREGRDGGLVTVGAGDFGVLVERGNFVFKEPSAGTELLREAIGRDAVIVTESFAIKRGGKVGGTVELPTPQGRVPFRIVGVYYDYSTDRGTVAMDWQTFVKYFGEERPTNMSIFLNEGADPDAARVEILDRLGEQYRVFVFTNSTLRKEVLRIFDSTFAITYALEAIAIFVAILGVASTLLTMILERRHELTVLRLVGADRRQVRKMVVIEAATLGGVSQGVGIGVGLLLSLVLIYVINVQSFGWTIQFHVPWVFLGQSSLLIVVATALSGIYPAHRAMRWALGESGE
jgi:putative ABC transport system permease protein